MDFFSHGLWTHLAFRAAKQPKKILLFAVLFGLAPDMFSFGFDFLFGWTGLGDVLGIPTVSGNWGDGTVRIPSYIVTLYDITHSLVIFSLVFLIVWVLRKRKIFWPMLAWGLHIVMDIPTHSSFFPTPFLWPLSEYRFHGISWATPWFFMLNWVLLGLLYIILFVRKQKRV